MNKASDIERMLVHIGSPDMLYREFDTSRSEARARADWRLLDAASGGPGDDGTVADSAVAQGGFDRTEVVTRRPVSYVERSLDVPPEPPATLPEEPPAAAAGRGQLQRVFQRLQGPVAAPAEDSSVAAPKEETPLSQLFRRLS